MGLNTKKRIFLIIAALLLLSLCAVAALAFQPDVRSALADEYIPGDESVLGFEVISSSPSGIVIPRSAQSGFNIMLRLNGERMNPASTKFYYKVATSINDATAQWEEFRNVDSAAGTATLYLNDMTLSGETVVRRYLYFRTTLQTGTNSDGDPIYQEYVYERFFSLIVDNGDTNAGNYAITQLSATYLVNGNPEPYDLQNPQWVSADITLKAYVGAMDTNPEASEAAAAVYYARTGTGINDEPVNTRQLPATPKRDDSGYWYYEIVLDETFQGDVSLYSSNPSNSTGTTYGSSAMVLIDKEQPNLDVSATLAGDIELGIAAGTPYANGAWAPTNVIYTVTPASQCISGTRYYYNTSVSESTWVELTEQTGTGVYQITISQTTSVLRFRARSDAGVTYNYGTILVTNIDKNAPTLNISAVDGKNTEIRSMGTEVTGGGTYRVGYASGRIDFTLRNGTVENTTGIGSGSTFYYREGDGAYQQIPQINGNYTLSRTQLTAGTTYTFLVRTGAGLEAERSFSFAVLPDTIELTMDPLYLDNQLNEAGWLRTEIPVYLNLPDFLPTDLEYRIYRQIGNRAAVELNAVQVESVDGIAKYLVYIDQSIQNEAVSFYAVSMADDRSNTVATESLRIDLETPNAEVVKYLEGGLQLSEEDWARDRVTIQITPAAQGQAGYNISGVRCYIRYGTVRGPELTLTNGVYSYQVIASGTFGFVLESGAGRTYAFDVAVNIDNSDITFTGVEATYFDEELGEDVSIYPNSAETPVSRDVTIRFNTNQAGHFIYYYYDYTNTTLTGDLSAYTRGEGDYFVFPMPTYDDGNRMVRFAFILQSRAVDRNGERSTSQPVTVTIYYDISDFSIVVETTYTFDGNTWVEGTQLSYNENGVTGTRNGIPFTASLADGSTANVAYWQYKLVEYGKSATNQPWITFSRGGSEATFNFFGINRVYEGITLGYSFNGQIYFRAVNNAGHASSETGSEFRVLLDNTNPSAFLSIVQTAGEIVERDNGFHDVMSVNNISIRPLDATHPLYYQLAPLTFHYASISEPNQQLQSGDYNVLNGALTVTGYYSIYASNNVGGAARDGQATVFRFVHDTTPLTAIIEGGTRNAQGIREFPWSSRAIVYVTPTSTGANSNIYYEYQIDGGEWVRYNAVASPVDEAMSIVFIGDETYRGDYTMYVVCNIDATVMFRIVNQSGAVTELEPFRIRIDVQDPEFDIVTTVNGQQLDENDRELEWQPDAVDIQIVPIAVNPSGVRYTYAVNNSGTYQKLPGNGTFFSTDDLVGFDGDGTVTITIRATRNAVLEGTDGSAISQKTITLNIDRQNPEFELVGQITVPGTANVREIKSGDWTNADEVRITLNPLVKNASPVSYYHYVDDRVEDRSPWQQEGGIYDTHSYTTISTVHVIAEASSGRTVEQTFDVKIDRDAPVIKSGVIVNSTDPSRPNRYYIDQMITYIEPNLKSAYYYCSPDLVGGYPLSNGQIIATNTVDTSTGGYVHIIIEDMAGNRAELVFYMTIFDLTVNTITLSDEDRALLQVFEDQFERARDTLSDSRRAYFQTYISRLYDRIATLEKQVEDYQAYLRLVNDRGETAFELRSDYAQMAKYVNYFETNDTLVRYPDWLQATITEGQYAQYYAKLKNAYERLEAQMAEVRSIQQMIVALPATNMVARTDYDGILRVYGDYQNLTIDQQSVFETNLYNKMMELKRLCEVLLLQDESTGISIDGQDLTAGARITVYEYDRSSETFNNAQMTIMETIPETGSRALIYMVTIGMEGYGSQMQTGTITITLPIPVGYRDYVYFAVYRVSSTGTISQVQNVTINGDGESVYFTATSLDTFILATSANLTVREPSSKVYGTIGTIEIDGTMLTYITFAAVGLFLVILLVLIIVGLRHRSFLRQYDKAHRNTLLKRGISKIPKGNTLPMANPARPEERVEQTHKYFVSQKPKKEKEPKAEKNAKKDKKEKKDK